MEGYGIVFGGGGAKGGYEIGVWRALRELDIPVEAVAGTSVGALNGAIMVQDDFDTAYKLWTSLSVESVIKVEREIAAAEENRRKSSAFLNIVKKALASGGLDISPLKALLQEVIDEKKIREASADLGIVTFSLSDFKPLRLFKKDIPEGKLLDYLLASACFPAFKREEIDNKKFIDGGLYDNIPISLMIEKGIKNIIAVDISGPGFTRRVDTKGFNVIYIKNSEDLGGVLEFNSERSKNNIEIGYLDTLKAFKKLKGNKYYLLPEEKSSSENHTQNLRIEDLKKMYKFLGMDSGGKNTAGNKFILDKIMRTLRQYADMDENFGGDTIYPAMAEITAEQLGVDRRRAYRLEELVEEIMKEHDKIKSSRDFNEYMRSLTRLMLSRNQLEFDREVKMTLIEGKFLISYDPYINEEDEKIKRFRRFVAIAFPKISIANMFISMMLMKKS